MFLSFLFSPLPHFCFVCCCCFISRKFVFVNLYIHHDQVTQCHCNRETACSSFILLNTYVFFWKEKIRLSKFIRTYSCKILANKLCMSWEFNWKVSCIIRTLYTYIKFHWRCELICVYAQLKHIILAYLCTSCVAIDQINFINYATKHKKLNGGVNIILN